MMVYTHTCIYVHTHALIECSWTLWQEECIGYINMHTHFYGRGGGRGTQRTRALTQSGCGCCTVGIRGPFTHCTPTAGLCLAGGPSSLRSNIHGDQHTIWWLALTKLHVNVTLLGILRTPLASTSAKGTIINCLGEEKVNINQTKTFQMCSRAGAGS